MPQLFLAMAFLATLTVSSVFAAELKQVSPSAIKSDGDQCGGEGHLADVQCLARFLKTQEREFNQIYKHALEALPEKDDSDSRRDRVQLVKSQRAWLKYRDENCSFIGGQEGGSNLWVTDFSMQCQKNETAKRIQFLKSVVAGNAH